MKNEPGRFAGGKKKNNNDDDDDDDDDDDKNRRNIQRREKRQRVGERSETTADQQQRNSIYSHRAHLLFTPPALRSNPYSSTPAPPYSACQRASIDSSADSAVRRRRRQRRRKTRAAQLQVLRDTPHARINRRRAPRFDRWSDADTERSIDYADSVDVDTAYGSGSVAHQAQVLPMPVIAVTWKRNQQRKRMSGYLRDETEGDDGGGGVGGGGGGDDDEEAQPVKKQSGVGTVRDGLDANRDRCDRHGDVQRWADVIPMAIARALPPPTGVRKSCGGRGDGRPPTQTNPSGPVRRLSNRPLGVDQ